MVPACRGTPQSLMFAMFTLSAMMSIVVVTSVCDGEGGGDGDGDDYDDDRHMPMVVVVGDDGVDGGGAGGAMANERGTKHHSKWSKTEKTKKDRGVGMRTETRGRGRGVRRGRPRAGRTNNLPYVAGIYGSKGWRTAGSVEDEALLKRRGQSTRSHDPKAKHCHMTALSEEGRADCLGGGDVSWR